MRRYSQGNNRILFHCISSDLVEDQRIANLEMIFIRLLHLLAHHPDFDLNDIEGLKDFTKSASSILEDPSVDDNVYLRYLNFYLDLVSTADNLPLLYHLAMKVKTIRDGESDDHSKVSNSETCGHFSQSAVQRTYMY
jgi:hypothetical protein